MRTFSFSEFLLSRLFLTRVSMFIYLLFEVKNELISIVVSVLIVNILFDAIFGSCGVAQPIYNENDLKSKELKLKKN